MKLNAERISMLTSSTNMTITDYRSGQVKKEYEMDKLYEVSRAHQRYYVNISGTKTSVPGVTTVLSVLNKPALVIWANRLGLQGIDSSKYRDEAADIGTLAHLMCQVTCENIFEKQESKDDFINQVLGLIDTTTFSKLQIDSAKIGFGKFVDWFLANDVKPIKNELQLVSERHLYGGTIDLLADINGVRTLVDFKTSKDIYDEQLCQVSAYAELLRENGYKVEQIMILRIGRNEDEGFDTRTVDLISANTYFNIFKSALAIYNLKKTIGWR